MTVNRLHLASPVQYVDPCQLHGLEDGAFFAQPLWPGRRAVLEQDGTWHWCSSARHFDLRQKYVHLGWVGLALELVMMEYRRIRVADVIIARRMQQRCRIAEASNINLHATRVRSVDDVNAQLSAWMGVGGAQGVVLKRESAPYPWLPHAGLHSPDWITVQEPLPTKEQREESDHR